MTGSTFVKLVWSKSFNFICSFTYSTDAGSCQNHRISSRMSSANNSRHSLMMLHLCACILLHCFRVPCVVSRERSSNMWSPLSIPPHKLYPSLSVHLQISVVDLLHAVAHSVLITQRACKHAKQELSFRATRRQKLHLMKRNSKLCQTVTSWLLFGKRPNEN